MKIQINVFTETGRQTQFTKNTFKATVAGGNHLYQATVDLDHSYYIPSGLEQDPHIDEILKTVQKTGTVV